MSTPYSAEDFTWLADLTAGRNVKVEHPTSTVVRPQAELVILAALRIAASVMKPGPIEMACAKLAGLLPEAIDIDQWRPEAGIIRAALLKDGTNG